LTNMLTYIKERNILDSYYEIENKIVESFFYFFLNKLMYFHNVSTATLSD
jgi:hypothetical protein